jgi:DNA-binding NarL/FixJ family response regulator
MPFVEATVTEKRGYQFVEELTILLADDHEVVRRGLRAFLDSHAGWKVIDEASTGREAVEKARRLKPQVVILDVTLPELTGLEVARRILAESPDMRVVFFSMHNSEQMVSEALHTGAHGYVLKSDSSGDLVLAIEASARRQIFLSPKLASTMSTDYLKDSAKAQVPEPPAKVLTPREREVLQLLAEGKNSKDTAAILGITLKTVETHRANLMSKLNLHSLSGLVRYAIRNKIVQP